MGAYGSRQFREHLEALKGNDPGLYALSLEQVPLGDEGARLLARALHGNRVLRRLCLGHCGISSIGLQSLASALCDGRSVPSRLRRLELVSMRVCVGLNCLQVPVMLTETTIGFLIFFAEYEPRPLSSWQSHWR